jgi:hypothetical protein
MRISSRHVSGLLALTVALSALVVTGAQAGSKPDAGADVRAIHWKHEDALYGARQETSRAQTAGDQLAAIHWKHEDALYRARDVASGSPRAATTAVVAAGDGFGWSETLRGAGGVVALLVAAAAATILVRRRHSRFVPS